MVDILIRNASWAVTMDETRRIIKDCTIAIEGGKIVDAGKSHELDSKYSGAEFVINARNKLVLPGLIDGHVHNVQHLAKGLADEVDITTWLYDRVYPFEAEMKEDDAHASALLCQLELIKAGITCFYDPGSYYPDQIAKATGISGLRGLISRSSLDLHETARGSVPTKLFRESTEETLRKGEEMVRRWNGAFDGRVRGSFALRLLTDCSDELCVRTGELASKYGVLIQTHGDASKHSAEASKEHFGTTGVERLRKLGVLGPHVLMIHMGGITPRGIMMISETGAKGVACPVASAHHGGTTSQYLPEMFDLGINVCFGSDSGPNGNFLDVVRAMHFGALSTKRDRADARVLSPEQLLEMATLRAAKVGFLESEIGSLEVGKRADIAVFDLNRPEWRPVYNPVASLIYCASGSSADSVIVNGKVLMQEGKVLSLEEEKVMEDGQRRGLAIAGRANLLQKAAPRWPIV